MQSKRTKRSRRPPPAELGVNWTWQQAFGGYGYISDSRLSGLFDFFPQTFRALHRTPCGLADMEWGRSPSSDPYDVDVLAFPYIQPDGVWWQNEWDDILFALATLTDPGDWDELAILWGVVTDPSHDLYRPEGRAQAILYVRRAGWHGFVAGEDTFYCKVDPSGWVEFRDEGLDWLAEQGEGAGEGEEDFDDAMSLAAEDALEVELHEADLEEWDESAEGPEGWGDEVDY